eukprot:gene4283-biopygen2268
MRATRMKTRVENAIRAEGYVFYIDMSMAAQGGSDWRVRGASAF